MSIDRSNPRNPTVEVDSMFLDRWSPRAFDPQPLTQAEIDSLCEAARWAPSCYNDQPWLLVYAAREDDRKRFLEALVEANQVWCTRVPLLLFVLCRRNFAHNGKENRHASFDAGAAWMSLALQARKLGLHAHAMAGFSRDKAYEVLKASRDEYEIMAAVAVGRRAAPEVLPEAAAAKERPNQRKALSEVAREGSVGG